MAPLICSKLTQLFQLKESNEPSTNTEDSCKEEVILVTQYCSESLSFHINNFQVPTFGHLRQEGHGLTFSKSICPLICKRMFQRWPTSHLWSFAPRPVSAPRTDMRTSTSFTRGPWLCTAFPTFSSTYCLIASVSCKTGAIVTYQRKLQKSHKIVKKNIMPLWSQRGYSQTRVSHKCANKSISRFNLLYLSSRRMLLLMWTIGVHYTQ